MNSGNGYLIYKDKNANGNNIYPYYYNSTNSNNDQIIN
jgi:hypothetical protein